MKFLRFYLLVLLLFTSACFIGCKFFGPLKPVPVAEGHDPVVVYAERAQRSSLGIYEVVIAWETTNRVALPVEVSRAVDKVRTEFPPAWRESRRALELYKQGVSTNASTMDRITGALLVFQDTLLQLKQGNDPNEIIQVGNALSSIVNSIRIFFGGANATPPLPANHPVP